MTQKTIDAFAKPSPMGMDVDEDLSSTTINLDTSHRKLFRASCTRIREECNASAAKGVVILVCEMHEDLDRVKSTRFGSYGYGSGDILQVECYCSFRKKHTTIFGKALKAMAQVPMNQLAPAKDLIARWETEYNDARSLYLANCDASGDDSRGRSKTPKPTVRSASSYSRKRDASCVSSSSSITSKQARVVEGDANATTSKQTRVLEGDAEEQLFQALAIIDRLTKEKKDLEMSNAELNEELCDLRQANQKLREQYLEIKSAHEKLAKEQSTMHATFDDRLKKLEGFMSNAASAVISDAETARPDGDNVIEPPSDKPSWSTVAASSPPVKSVTASPKIEKWAKECLMPKRDPVQWEKLAFSHNGSRKFRNISKVERSQLIRSMFSIMGIWNKISLYSAIGKSVFEIYFPAQFKSEIIAALTKNHCSVIDLNANTETWEEKVVEAAAKRLAFLLSIRDTIRIQKCILAGTPKPIMDQLKTIVASTTIDKILKTELTPIVSAVPSDAPIDSVMDLN